MPAVAPFCSAGVPKRTLLTLAFFHGFLSQWCCATVGQDGLQLSLKISRNLGSAKIVEPWRALKKTLPGTSCSAPVSLPHCLAALCTQFGNHCYNGFKIHWLPIVLRSMRWGFELVQGTHDTIKQVKEMMKSYIISISGGSVLWPLPHGKWWISKSVVFSP